MAWIFGGRKSPRGSRAPPPPYPQQPSEEQKLEQMLIQQQLLQSQQPQPQQQHRHAGTGSGTPAPHPLQPHQHQQHRGAPPPYQQPPAQWQQPPSGAGTQQQTASVKRLRYQALDRIDVVLAPEVCAERDAMLSQMDALKCLQVDIAERRARYPAIDLSLERMKLVLDALGNPEKRLPSTIHIAGTNGKGSTTAFLRAALEADGKGVMWAPISQASWFLMTT